MMTSTAKGFVVACLLCAICACAQSPQTELRYHLRTGDRLVYREVFDRELHSADTSFHTHTEFLNQLVVVADTKTSALVGVQRNRQSSQLLAYRERGNDKLAEQLPTFAEQTAKRPARFADASLYLTTGAPQTPIQAVREANSKLLYLLSEVTPLPSLAVAPGSEWSDPRLGVKLRLTAYESVAGEECANIQDDGSRKDLHLRYWFCPHSGVMRKMEFEGEYRGFADQRFHEKVAFELLESHSGENPATWLANPQVQRAVLRAYLISSGPMPEPQAITALLSAAEPEVQALALAVFLQHREQVPQSLLATLAKNSDPEVQRIASRFTPAATNNSANPCALPPKSYQPQTPGTTLHHSQTPGFTDVPYAIRVPIDYRPDQSFPLIIYLSGGGGQALDAALSADEALRHSGYLALYPHAAGDMWWNQRPTEMVDALLSEVLRAYNVETNRIYLAGFSNGGTGSIYYGTLWPYRFAAISSLMGAGMYAPGDNDVQWPMANLLNVPVLFLHGDKDTIIPDQASIATYNELKGLHPRVTPELHLLKKRGHDLTLSSEDGHTLPFFEHFVREPFPRSISAKISAPKYSRHYWIEVLDQSGPAEIEGRVLADNTVEIKTRNVRKLRLLLRPELFVANTPIRVRINGKERFSGELKNDCELFQQSAQQWADPWLAYTQAITIDLAHQPTLCAR